tara:strand:+ start:12332 stop:12526 length:195 start_codon:yes stop_codon:yes gene_type:complete
MKVFREARTVFKREWLVGEAQHEWQSSYAMDCRSMDPGANPGSCSTIYPITAFSVYNKPMTSRA